MALFWNDKRAVDYVGSSLYQCVRPWLNMLHMYQGMGRQREFEIIARRLHDDFNLGVILWSAGTEPPMSGVQGYLEAYPHVVQQITACWAQKDCLDYINTLLEDNRAGVRHGFTLGAFEELLLLAELLEGGRGPHPLLREDAPEQAPAMSAAGHPYRLLLTGTLALLNRLHIYYPKRLLALRAGPSVASRQVRTRTAGLPQG